MDRVYIIEIREGVTVERVKPWRIYGRHPNVEKAKDWSRGFVCDMIESLMESKSGTVYIIELSLEIYPASESKYGDSKTESIEKIVLNNASEVA